MNIKYFSKNGFDNGGNLFAYPYFFRKHSVMGREG